MHRAALTFVLVGLVASPLAAQGRGRGRSQGIPPGHLPPPGQCRVWYDNTPPGHQPPPTNCREAERIAARDGSARVIYGASRGDDGWRGENRGDRDRESGRYGYPDRYPGGRDGYGYGTVPFDNGFKDGYDKGRNDARGRRAYDPLRQSQYRSADRGYNSRYGSKEEYRNVYRDGFRAGYDEGYRDAGVYSPNRRDGGSRLPWPF